eukprot:CAMPEP_0181213526 /NCGR_PEP_ID=MMETSP1096-20121128/24949_1 /TAXON_ID=156174 ORGANISM="Chrysochromulina ericina, Strain CCMP281" /NCGR_SAMPLE_ID=MMETSP1096 /ASSEMBLY_ACC=CAM_ASM_000453 /LENGTH=105 /DNA_ID=CAMNT_0023305165 /DNA_START=145 /DNA_END=462 /DNA_ORIENTATION=+
MVDPIRGRGVTTIQYMSQMRPASSAVFRNAITLLVPRGSLQLASTSSNACGGHQRWRCEYWPWLGVGSHRQPARAASSYEPYAASSIDSTLVLWMAQSIGLPCER